MMWLTILQNKWTLRAGALLVAVTAFMLYRSSLIKDGERKEAAKVALIVAEQKAIAEAQTRNMKEIADEAQSQYIKDMAAAKAAADRAAADLARLRSKAASSGQLANASREAIATYAADAERSVDFCAEELVRVGETASSASAAAWALNDAWPEYKEFQDRLTDFTTKLKGNTP
jgi:hypothetical protein